MKTVTAILKYPPDYDGELHITVEPHHKILNVSLSFAVQEGETTKDALKRLGRELASQPMFILE